MPFPERLARIFGTGLGVEGPATRLAPGDDLLDVHLDLLDAHALALEERDHPVCLLDPIFIPFYEDFGIVRPLSKKLPLIGEIPGDPYGFQFLVFIHTL